MLTFFLACTQYSTVQYSTFRSFGKHRRARERGEHASERERKINNDRLFSSSPTTTLLRWRSINPPRFIFIHARSTDFEEKIEGLKG